MAVKMGTVKMNRTKVQNKIKCAVHINVILIIGLHVKIRK